ncbi:MAG TPA: anti-sigma factor [Bryobacteraceae bacterium]|jgi:hypothetical protein|nr:anti-sigma factor [Bryobacteraceae bacterium]
MSCEELRESYELYAMGVLEEPERDEIREHLGRACPACTAGVRQAREMVAMMVETVPPLAPSRKLRGRILASVGVEQSRWWLMPLLAGLSMICFVAAIYFYGRQDSLGIEIARVREEYRRQTIELTERNGDLARLNEALALLNQPETRQVTFGTGAPQPPRGKVFVHPRQGVLLLASHLPPAPAGKIYEMWILPKGGKPVPAGLFQSDAEGSALHLQRVPLDVAGTSAIAVTLEAEGGAAQPTSTPLIVAAL